jgi:hypothetical protein
MYCPLCEGSKTIPVNKKNVAEHLIVTKDKENHFHVHGPVSNKALIQDMVMYILKEAEIGYSISQGSPPTGAETVPEESDKKD